MKKVPVLSVDFYEFKCPEEILNPIKDHLFNVQKFKKNENNLISTESLEFPDLEDWIHQCLDLVKKDKFTNVTYDLKISQIWANRTKKFQFHHKHYHPNSIVSGILYLNVNQGYGQTHFFMKDPWWHVHNEGFLKLTEGNNDYAVEIQGAPIPEEGKLVIFPSSIMHTTHPHTSLEDRFTISFNSFFRGTNNRFTLKLTL
jgi:uncharacterized protein (TIGR02466 family)